MHQDNLTGSFSGLNMYRIWTRGREVKSILASSTGGPAYNHYIRLFMLSGIDILITIPLNIWYFTTFFQIPVSPWPGWKFVHSNWSQIEQYTTADVKSSPPMFYQFEVTRWMCVVYGFVFFGLLGVTAEARKHYWSAWKSVSKLLCLQTGLLRESSGYVLGSSCFDPFLTK
jgi:pheromone a factor receptor